MTTIKSEVSKEKKSKVATYSFEVNNEAFKACHSPGRESTLQITHNGSELGTILWAIDGKRKVEYEVNSGEKPLTITAWINNSFSYMGIGSIKGIGIEVNGIPVQHTLADPETHLKNGRSWLYVLLFILSVRSIYTYFVAGISSAIYIAPLIVAIIAAVKYKTWTAFAILSGIIISALEMADYITAIPASHEANAASGSGSGGIVIWMFLRIGILYALCNAFKWERKRRKASRQAEVL